MMDSASGKLSLLPLVIFVMLVRLQPEVSLNQRRRSCAHIQWLDIQLSNAAFEEPGAPSFILPDQSVIDAVPAAGPKSLAVLNDHHHAA